MMRANRAMRSLWGEAFVADRPEIAPIDRYVFERGWTVGPNGALLLTALWPGSGGFPASDLGGEEYEVNDLDLSLTDLDRSSDTFLERAASRCLHGVRLLLAEARDLPDADKLVGVAGVSVDTDDELFELQGGNVRFFTRRGRYPDWFDDLEGFTKQAIAVLDVSDLAA